ncbi:helix-turn-helix transcriptional regulator [Xanthobacter sp. V4C-4]|uniref:helix-turn-helix domain-containing protein n=1 Tax=Xanthobacter cornucopiae TaxID=3119924 RepID=UPI003726D257
MRSRDAKPKDGATLPSLDADATKAAFAGRLKTWRKMNGIKQAALADMLGVSQAAVSFWEGRRDLPSPAALTRLEALMAHSARDEVMVERLFVERQAGVRALIDFDGARFIAASRGFCALWPQTGELRDHRLADWLVNEAQKLFFDKDLRHAIVSGNLGLASGVSERMMSLEVDQVVPHRWHMCFRRYGPRTLVDVVYEPCAGDQPTGIEDLVYLDDCKPA